MARSRPLLTEAQWKRIAPLLPKPPKHRKGGRPWIDNRRVLEGILWILRSGARWQDLPEKYPHPSTCWRRLRDWEEQGVWLNIWRAFLSELNEREELDWSESFLDGSFAPAKKGAQESGKPSGARGRSGWWWSTARVFLWGAPEDEEVHSYINQLASSVGTYLYGRRMYETMVYWETAHTVPDQPQFVLDWARRWQAAEKIVYSRTLAEPRSARTRIEREFDPDAVRGLKADARHDITVNGPGLAAHALRAGLVDELQMFVCPAVVGAGKRFFPDRVRLKLELVNEHRFRHGVVVLRYAVRG